MEINMLVPPNHYSSTVHGDIENICSVLFSSSPISVFLQARIFDNGDCVALTNIPKWSEHHLNNHYTVAPTISENLLSDQFYYIVDENNPFNAVVHYLANLFNVHCPFYIFRRYHGYFDMFVFALKAPINGIINYYLNNYDTLNTFIDYFQDSSTDIYNTHMKNKLFIPDIMRASFKGLRDNDESIRENLKSQKLLRQFSIKTSNNKIVRLTKRESDVLYYLSMGMTAKESANQLNISSKTVEWYIANTKKN